MPFRIQRVPRGLNELLSIFGGATPTELEDRVQATLDLIQAYGLQQRRVFAANDPALAENTAVVSIPAPTSWVVYFGGSLTIIKTATMTALEGAFGLRYNNDVTQEAVLASRPMGPFGATETGAVTVGHRNPFPLLLPPNTMFFGRPQIIGTDANCNATIGIDLGILG